jgi:hypothetical protein
MYRRVVSLLLLPAVLLTQWSGVGHSHGSFQPAGHDHTPHVHSCLLSSHHHDGYEGRHHDQDADPGDPEQAECLGQSAPVEDHDDDAVYIPASALLRLRGQSSQDRSSEWSDPVATGAMVSTPLAVPRLFPPLSHPPPRSCRPHCPDCPVYLQTCALLI